MIMKLHGSVYDPTLPKRQMALVDGTASRPSVDPPESHTLVTHTRQAFWRRNLTRNPDTSEGFSVEIFTWRFAIAICLSDSPHRDSPSLPTEHKYRIPDLR